MFRAAECLMIQEDYLGAVDACANGLKRHPGVGELAWLAALASHKAGNYLDAVCWARMSIALGCVEGVGDRINRVGFTQPHARYEGPYDVLRFAEQALGNADEAARAEEMHARAKALRRERGLA